MYEALGQALPAQSLRPSFPAESRFLAECGFLQEGRHVAVSRHTNSHSFAAKGGLDMNGREQQTRAMMEAYDDEAEATGWHGPEVAFGLTYTYIQRGQSILDIGIGTGLGSVLFRKAGLEVYGMDVSPEMLDACRIKGFTNLKVHDLQVTPYPYDLESMDHVSCVGVLNFLRDLTPVFAETARILKKGGLFVFAVGDRTEDEDVESVVGAEHTGSGQAVSMYRHSARQIDGWVKRFRLTPLKSLPFTAYMDREKTRSLRSKAYLAKKTASIE
jgi:SAM-dependent methyltransferase